MTSCTSMGLTYYPSDRATLAWMNFKQPQVLLMCFWCFYLLKSITTFAHWLQHTCCTFHLQVSMASEEFLTFDLSFVWDWAWASSSSERSSSGKGTLQYWNELNVQSSVVLSASAWKWWERENRAKKKLKSSYNSDIIVCLQLQGQNQTWAKCGRFDG